jgi:glycine cleavage system H protein
MPLSGEITEVNSGLEDAPESVNESPYENGWMIKIKLSDTSELDGLLDVAAYKALIGQ